ncbi:MAG: hypothetical protein LBV00_07850 [Propionibacteriaceae bacterium]|nr:hypothetical protein [Propionibacteriaceae bacterium]
MIVVAHVGVNIPALRDHVEALRRLEVVLLAVAARLQSLACDLRLAGHVPDVTRCLERGDLYLQVVEARRQAEEVLTRAEAIARDQGVSWATAAVTPLVFPLPPIVPDERSMSRATRSLGPVGDAPGTEGETYSGVSVSDGVPGMVCVEWPEAPAWTSDDSDSGQYGSRAPNPGDIAMWEVVATAAQAVCLVWPDAARNLMHYLRGVGSDLEQAVDSMVEDMPAFEATIGIAESVVATAAVERARAEGVTGPTTYAVNSDWTTFYATPEMSRNWYYATGGFSFSVSGQVVVYPPDSLEGKWRYEWSRVVNYRDRYNWDLGKSTEILGMTVTDEQVNELREAGLAQNFTLVWRSSPRGSSGEV